MNYTANQRSLHQFGGLLYGFRFLRFRQQGIRQGVHPQEHSADRTVKASPTEGPDLLLERVGINCHLKQDGLGCLEVTVEYGDYSMLEEGRSCTPTTNQVVIQPVVKSPLSADNPASLCESIVDHKKGRRSILNISDWNCLCTKETLIRATTNRHFGFTVRKRKQSKPQEQEKRRCCMNVCYCK